MRWRAELVPRSASCSLALDEALLDSARGGGESMVRLWLGERAVVIGRSQRIEDEVDREAAEAERVPVFRRISGGGAVMHYPGNLNISLTMRDARELGTVEEAFSRVGGRLAAGLRELGMEVRSSGSSLMTPEGKISGAAQARRGSAVLYHCTLLVAPAVLPMTQFLRALRGGYSPKGIPSRPRRTTTLCEMLQRPISVAEVAELVAKALEDLVGGFGGGGALTPAEVDHAEHLRQVRYEDPRWNAAR